MPSERSALQWIVLFIEKYWLQFLKGTGMTVLLAVIGTAAGFVIGLIIGVVRTIPKQAGGKTGFSLRALALGVLNSLLAIYTEVLRGTPMMVQAMLIYYGLTEFAKVNIAAIPAGMIVITLNTGAYMAEIVRGGIQSIDPGQSEAAKAIGMNHWKTMLYVVLPQAVRNILPATGNEFVVNLKDSSVLNVITVTELFYATRAIRGSYYRTYEPFLIAAAIYLALTFISSRLLRLLEKYLDGPRDFSLAQNVGRTRRK
ncbi:MAG: amino acid ABC transporter permease [Oscillospiraceae bacterium]|jgi:putative lysine transport system permease protein|nr:amino acid ABC transporter permease [Oscillospiraceae bacterium]